MDALCDLTVGDVWLKEKHRWNQKMLRATFIPHDVQATSSRRLELNIIIGE